MIDKDRDWQNSVSKPKERKKERKKEREREREREKREMGEYNVKREKGDDR